MWALRAGAAHASHPAALPQTGWEPVSLPHHWSAQWPGFEGTVWYRIDWRRSCGAKDNVLNGKGVVEAARPLGMALDYLNMAGAIFVNQELLWRDASLIEPLSRSWNSPRFFALPGAALKPDHNALFVQVVGASRFDSGLGSLVISNVDEAAAFYDNRRFFFRTLPGVNLVISLTLGTLFLALWLMRREDAAYGWYALTSALWVIFLSNTLVTTPWPFATTESWSRWITASMVLFCGALCLFLWTFAGQRFVRLARALGLICLLAVLVLVLMPTGWYAQATFVVFVGCVVLFMAVCLQFIVRAAHTRSLEHLLLAACLVGFVVAAAHDTLMMLRVITAGSALTPVTAPLITLGMSLILASRFARSLQRVESFNGELEIEVNSARDHLARTLTREHQLELDNVRLGERLQLAHDLHDGLGSSLVRSIALVEQSGQAIEVNQYLSMFKSLRDDLRQVIDTSSSGSAAVPDTPQQWLAPIRYRFVQLFDELGLESEWGIPLVWPGPLTMKQLLGLTRILEEALTNALKHSRASRLSVCLRADGQGRMQLQIQDNGVGFEVARVSESMLGIGLRSMQARASRIGCHLQITSSPAGSCIQVQTGVVSGAALQG